MRTHFNARIWRDADLDAVTVGSATIFMGAWLGFWGLVISRSYKGQFDILIPVVVFLVLAGIVCTVGRWIVPVAFLNLVVGIILGTLFIPTWKDNKERNDKPGQLMAVLMMGVPGAVGLGSAVPALMTILGG